ncbi:hypothetical protein JDV02_005076 [Purpureocillium takamizusanense]|uniref:MARVEL domain-containing protein n=1 Tax=Purpureocillium takamizusanense TaxID=2060973 RepID=A0A9Q8V9Z6_9HYPO|nr:uncharacterized protein JDV02_005076 [Purpureocillium takamizusanense]UNI18830.1 hypothetical protein JDV02_005076 [Purpureocillium takamizusanense]
MATGDVFRGASRWVLRHAWELGVVLRGVSAICCLLIHVSIARVAIAAISAGPSIESLILPLVLLGFVALLSLPWNGIETTTVLLRHGIGMPASVAITSDVLLCMCYTAVSAAIATHVLTNASEWYFFSNGTDYTDSVAPRFNQMALALAITEAALHLFLVAVTCCGIHNRKKERRFIEK